MKRSDLLRAASLGLVASALFAGCGGGGSVPPLGPPAFRAFAFSHPISITASAYTPRRTRDGMLILKDGEIIAPAPDVSGTNGSPYCPNPHWQGNTPPSCADSGEFRRVYSNPTQWFTIGDITLPTKGPKMVKNAKHDTGYIYLEGWPGVGTSNSEFGVFYEAGSKRYAIYYSTPETGEKPTGLYLDPGTAYEEALWGCTKACDYNGPNCKVKCIGGFIAATGTYYALSLSGDSGWAWNCCIFARMTTIAQPKGQDNFTDGSQFGPIRWTDSNDDPWFYFDCIIETDACGAGSGSGGPWVGGGMQSWPANSNIVQVTNRHAELYETDAIIDCGGAPSCPGSK